MHTNWKLFTKDDEKFQVWLSLALTEDKESLKLIKWSSLFLRSLKSDFRNIISNNIMTRPIYFEELWTSGMLFEPSASQISQQATTNLWLTTVK